MVNSKIKLDSWFIPTVYALSTLYFIYYLVWRVIDSMNPLHPWFSWLLWSAEAFGVLSFVLFAFSTKRIEPTRKWKKPEDNISVDIYVPTYNEDIEILKATFVGCAKQNYPARVYVLDDGDRPMVAAIAAEFGFNYIARPTHEHAKAGNINYALERTHGEFIVILDADMVPQPDFLLRTLAYFDDPNVAIIQLPQEFYNHDSIQHDKIKSSWHEQSLFFRVIQPGKNYTNSAFWCGSPSIVRRSVLEAVGGVATETITEDIHTNVRMNKLGYKTYFVNETLAFGIAPQTMKAFLTQRLRWAQGTMQLYRGKDSPIWTPGLTIWQRLSYLASFLAYFEAFQKFILISTPILILVLGIFPMQVDVVSFVIHWLPYFTLNILVNMIGGRGVFHYFKTEKFNLLKTLIFMESTLILFWPKPLTFKVTPKTVANTVYKDEVSMMKFYMGLFGSLVGSIIFSVFQGYLNYWHDLSLLNRIMALVWALYNAAIIAVALREIFTKKHERKHYRFPVHEKASLHGNGSQLDCELVDISSSGAQIVVSGKIPDQDMVFDMLVLKPEGKKEYAITLKPARRKGLVNANSISCGVLFEEMNNESNYDLFEYLFVHLPRVNASDPYLGSKIFTLGDSRVKV